MVDIINLATDNQEIAREVIENSHRRRAPDYSYLKISDSRNRKNPWY